MICASTHGVPNIQGGFRGMFAPARLPAAKKNGRRPARNAAQKPSLRHRPDAASAKDFVTGARVSGYFRNSTCPSM